MKFWRQDTHIVHGYKPMDMNDRKSEGMAIELALPYGFSDKAKACWAYMEDTVFLFEYKNRLIVTDDDFQLTDHGNGSPSSAFGGPRWKYDSWEELEKALENAYDALVDAGVLD